MSDCQVGDWVKAVHCPEAEKLPAFRITRIESLPWSGPGAEQEYAYGREWRDGQSVQRSTAKVRRASASEVRAVTIQLEDWVMGQGALGLGLAEGGVHGKLHKCGDSGGSEPAGCAAEPPCRHATPEEYRAAVGVEVTDKVNVTELLPEDRVTLDVPISIGDWVHTKYLGWAASLQKAYRVTGFKPSGIAPDRLVLNGGEELWSPSCLRTATPEEVAAVPIQKGDWYTAADYDKTYKAFKNHGPDGDCVSCARGLTCACRHATPEEYRAAVGAEEPGTQTVGGVKFTGLQPDSEVAVHDDPEVIHYRGKIDTGPKSELERSGDDGQRALVTKALEEHSKKIEALYIRNKVESGSYTAILKRLVALEAAPVEPVAPELPPILYHRLPMDGAYSYIRVSDSDTEGASLYASDNPKWVEAEKIWDALFTIDKPAARVSNRAEIQETHEQGHREGFAEARRKRWWHVDWGNVAVGAMSLAAIGTVVVVACDLVAHIYMNLAGTM